MNSTLSENAIILALLKLMAGMAELVDAPDSKSGDGDIVWVRFPLPAPCLLQTSTEKKLTCYQCILAFAIFPCAQ